MNITNEFLNKLVEVFESVAYELDDADEVEKFIELVFKKAGKEMPELKCTYPARCMFCRFNRYYNESHKGWVTVCKNSKSEFFEQPVKETHTCEFFEERFM